VRRLAANRQAALAAGVLAVLGTAVFLPADAQAANFELWGLAPATGAVLAAVRGRTAERGAWRWFALAGALVALAANIKQPYVVVGLPVAVEALRSARGRRVDLAAAAGGAVLATLPLAMLVDLGHLWRWAWADNGDYIDGGLSTARAFGVGVGLTMVFVSFHLPLLYGFWAAITRRVRLDLTILLWAAASLAVVPIGLRFFGHYYQQLVPPLAVLTGVALATAPRAAWRIVVGATLVATGVLVTISFALRPDLSDFTALGRYVQQTTAPNDRILVWGALPDVYVAAGRRPAGAFLHDGYLTGNWASREDVLDASVVLREPYRDRWSTFLRDLASDPPELVVDAARPGTDWAGYPPSRYPLGDLLDRCYQPAARLDGLPVWRLDRTACPKG
jgi:4-amino-4-deoxy-L-arabinose transferase-like glycosyltransferase